MSGCKVSGESAAGRRLLLWLAPPALLAIALAACQREQPQPAPARQPAPAVPAQAAVQTPPQPRLHDVIERDPRYIIGISYPPGVNQYPGLAAALGQYADAARGELMQAVDALGDDKPTAPYDLSLSFSRLVDTPGLVAIAADGSMYTGGAHGAPLVARFVWLAQDDRQLTARMLVPDKAAWRDIAAYVREQLHTGLSQRLDADTLPPADKAGMLRNGGRMIDDGTTPDPDNFSQFEPELGADGKIRALRFVFAPYQVGPYSDGVQGAEVPADVLLPHVAPEWRGLFVGG